MAIETSSSGEPFNLDKLKQLIELMEQHGLTEVNLRRGDERWNLRRGPAEVVQMVSAPAYPQMAPHPAPTAASPPAPGPGPAASKPSAEEGMFIKSPTVGTFYSAAAPGDPPFVQVGSKVTSETVVCIIEAMKVFNQITAELNGTILEILAKNGDAIEFGQPLFRVKLG